MSSSTSSTGREGHLKSWIDTWVASQSIPGMMVGIFDRDGKELFYHAADNSHRNKPHTPDHNMKAYTRDTLFRIYSMTKPITTVAAMILLERGLLSLDDELSKYIPSFQHVQVFVRGTVEEPVTESLQVPITIQHLLSHTSGITYGFFGATVPDLILRKNNGEDYKHWFHFTELSELCEQVAKTPLLFQPGKHFHYGLGTDILGRVIEIVSGNSLDVFFQEEIFNRLEMFDTFFQVPEDKVHRLAEVFEVAIGQSYSVSKNPERDRLSKPILLTGGGGLVSTLDDYAKFSCMLLNQGAYNGVRVLKEETVKMMTVNHLAHDGDLAQLSYDHSFSEVVGPGYGFGYGFSVLRDPTVGKGCELSGKGEYGWGGVAGTNFHNDPENNLSIIFLTSMIPGAAVYPIRAQLRYLGHWIFGNEN
jgi:CubicO group peptidase (beta-lactamase class C family)